MQLHDVSIILPTKNEAENIPHFLQSIPEKIKLIVVDASQDHTREIIHQLRPGNTIILYNTSHIAVARHVGANLADTQWLLFTDADVIFHPLYFDHLSNIGHFDGYYGPKLSFSEYIEYYESFSAWQRFFHRLGIPAASGSNLLIRRDVYFSIGGFDLDLRVNEDTELSWRIKRSRYSIAFDHELIVYARDHRRLKRGMARKNLHSIARCALLYLNLIPQKWRSSDWGYWKKS